MVDLAPRAERSVLCASVVSSAGVSPACFLRAFALARACIRSEFAAEASLLGCPCSVFERGRFVQSQGLSRRARMPVFAFAGAPCSVFERGAFVQSPGSREWARMSVFAGCRTLCRACKGCGFSDRLPLSSLKRGRVGVLQTTPTRLAGPLRRRYSASWLGHRRPGAPPSFSEGRAFVIRLMPIPRAEWRRRPAAMLPLAFRAARRPGLSQPGTCS